MNNNNLDYAEISLVCFFHLSSRVSGAPAAASTERPGGEGSADVDSRGAGRYLHCELPQVRPHSQGRCSVLRWSFLFLQTILKISFTGFRSSLLQKTKQTNKQKTGWVK